MVTIKNQMKTVSFITHEKSGTLISNDKLLFTKENNNSYVNTIDQPSRIDAVSSGINTLKEKLQIDAPLKSVARFFATVFISTIPAIALIDGGANINCLHSRILKQLEKENITYKMLDNNLGHVGTADMDGKLQVNGRVTLLCTLNNQQIPITFAITDNMHDDIILGRPFLHDATKATVENPPHLILKNNTHIPLTITPDCPAIPFSTSNAIQVRAHTAIQCIVKLAHKVSVDGHGLVIPKERYRQILISSLNKIPEHRDLVIQLENHTGSTIHIPKGVVLGHFEAFPVGSKVTEIRVTKE